MRFRYRLSTLLIVTAVVVFCLFLWLRYVSPHFTGVNIESDGVMIAWTNLYSARTHPELFGNSTDGEGLLGTTMFIGIPFYMLLAMCAIMVGAIVAAHLVIRRVTNWATPTSTAPPQSDE